MRTWYDVIGPMRRANSEGRCPPDTDSFGRKLVCLAEFALRDGEDNFNGDYRQTDA